MSRLLLALLGSLAAVLIAVIALELNDAGPADEAGLPVAAPRQVAAGQPVPAMEVATRVPEWAATVLARPLFSRDRRPSAQSAANVVTAGPLQLPRLTGVLVSGSGRSAMFADGAGGRATVVGEGAKIGRYTVQKIEAGQVTVAGPEGTRVLRTHIEKASAVKAKADRSGARRPGQGQPDLARLGIGQLNPSRAGPTAQPGNPADSD